VPPPLKVPERSERRGTDLRGVAFRRYRVFRFSLMGCLYCLRRLIWLGFWLLCVRWLGRPFCCLSHGGAVGGHVCGGGAGDGVAAGPEH